MKTSKKILFVFLSITSLITTTNPAFVINKKSTGDTIENPENCVLKNTIDKFIAKYLDGLTNHDGEIVTVPPRMIEKSIRKVNNALRSEQRDIRNGLYVNSYEGDVTIVGDTHGDFSCTSLIIKYFLKKLKINADEKIIFLGDYVDRGNESVKNFVVICSLKAKFPNNVYMLRGNHEDLPLNEKYGLFDEFDKIYHDCGGSAELSNKFASVYDNLPIFAILDNKFFCSHGGIPYAFNDSNYYTSKEYYTDVLWSDPWYPPFLDDSQEKVNFDAHGFTFNYTRKIGKLFNSSALKSFLKIQKLKAFIRSHQVVNLEQCQDINKEYEDNLFCVYSSSADILRQNVFGRGFVLIYDHDEQTLFYTYIKDLKSQL